MELMRKPPNAFSQAGQILLKPVALRARAGLFFRNVRLQIARGNAQSGDLLAEIVMQLPREASPFFFLGVNEAGTQTLDLLLRASTLLQLLSQRGISRAQLLLGLFALRNIEQRSGIWRSAHFPQRSQPHRAGAYNTTRPPRPTPRRRGSATRSECGPGCGQDPPR